MKKVFFLNSTIFLLLIFAYPVNAQESTNLSVEELFRLGIENNLKIQSSRVYLDIANEREQSAKTMRLPDFSVGLVGGYIGQPTVFSEGLSGPVHPKTPDWMQNYNVELVQPLYQGGRIKNNIDKSALEKQIASLNLDKDKADVKLLLIGKYLDLIRLYKQREVFEHNIKDSEQRLHDILKMKEQGMLTNNDVIRSELQLTNYKLALRETIDNISIVSQQLDIALGLKEDLLIMPDTMLLQSDLPVLSFEEYVASAYVEYPEIKIAESGIELAGKNLDLVNADYLPALSLRAANTLQRPITSTSPPTDLYMNSWNVSLVLSYKLSSFYKNKHNSNAAKQMITLQNVQKDELRQNIRMNVKAFYVKHQESLERVNALTISVKQANENYRIVQNRYFNQLAVMTDLLDASGVRLDAELQLTAAKANAVYTYYQLKKASGNL